MHKSIRLIVFFSLFFSVTLSIGHAAILSPGLERVLLSLSPSDEIPILITLSDKANIKIFKEKDKDVLRSKVIKALKDKADLSQKPLKAFLENRAVKKLKPLWVINAIAASARVDVIHELANLPVIESIRMDETLQAPVTGQGTTVLPEWNLNAIRAPDLWNFGYTGKGVVVATMDTGADANHPDLQDKWRGGVNSWYDPNGEHAAPFDRIGHGTQVLGIMVGGNSGGTSIGVAPDAKWIAVKIFNDAGVASLSAIHQGFQWLLDPDGNPDTDDAPDVVNNSWGLENINDCSLTSLEFQPDVQVLKVAEIGVVFAAGNYGPNVSTSIPPANYPESFPVGAIDQSLQIANFSSRGPSACGGDIFPGVVAPGVNVRTSDLTFGGVFPNSYRVVSGTSFAAPHVAGTMALLRSAFPSIRVSELETALKTSSSDLGILGPDNNFGYGLINASSAYYEVFQLFWVDIHQLVIAYYNNILGRAPEPGAAESWAIEIQRIVLLGIDVEEGFIGLAKTFFNSEEYLLQNKTDDQFITDLYKTFLNRIPAQWEIDYWAGYLAQGLSRNLILGDFAFSEEFKRYMEGIFRIGKTRSENNLVNDFYRGFLFRLPDTAGFHSWLGLMRTAQFTGAEAVTDLSRQTASAFINSAEYAMRNRNNRQYVEDLYDGILRRGADPAGFHFWVDALSTSTRDQVLAAFTDSPEFQLRVQEVINAGCLP